MLEPPLDQLGAADVDRVENMPGVVLHKGAAINDQCAFGPTSQKAGQLLRVHYFAWEFVPGHSSLAPSAASGRREGRTKAASSDLPEVKGTGMGRGREFTNSQILPRC